MIKGGRDVKRSEMIKDQNRFNYIIKHGHYNKDRYFVVYDVISKENRYPHFGIAIKTTIGKAVVRNRLKRQTRSIIDNNKKLFKNDRDYIIMIRNECLNSSYDALDNSLVEIMKGKMWWKKIKNY